MEIFIKINLTRNVPTNAIPKNELNVYIDWRLHQNEHSQIMAGGSISYFHTSP